jgi:shikimate kinase
MQLMDNLVLVGFSCSGKTTIGRNLARRLRLTFVDTDRIIEEVARRPIGDIFAQDGEAMFREIEQAAVAQACAGTNQVISTGGGAFVDPTNRERLRRGNLVVHLQVRPETVVLRLRNSRSGRPRPMLDAPDPLERVRELMAARREAYALAHVAIGVDDRSRHEVVSDLTRRWLAWRRRHGSPATREAATAVAQAPATPV